MLYAKLSFKLTIVEVVVGYIFVDEIQFFFIYHLLKLVHLIITSNNKINSKYAQIHRRKLLVLMVASRMFSISIIS